MRLQLQLLAAASMALAMSAFGSAASAQTTASTTTPPPACGGNSCPGTQTFGVGFTSLSGGFAGSVFEGQEGYNVLESKGYSGGDITLSAGGELCGIDCASGGFELEAYAGQHSKAMSGAFGEQSKTPVMVQNQTGAQATVGFALQKLTNPPE